MKIHFTLPVMMLLLAGCITAPNLVSPGTKIGTVPPTDTSAVTIEKALLSQPDTVKASDGCAELFKTRTYCFAVDSVTPLVRSEWTRLLPNTEFFLAKGVGVNREYLNVPDGAAYKTNYWIIAFQKGRMYEISQFPALLSANDIGVTEQNRSLVTRAFVLMALPYYIENDVVFLDSQTVDQKFDAEQYNYETTVWTKLHGLQINYFFFFDGPIGGRARLQRVTGYIAQYQTGEGYIPVVPQFNGHDLWTDLQFDYHFE